MDILNIDLNNIDLDNTNDKDDPDTIIFWLGILNLKNENHLIKSYLIPIAWHPKRWWNFAC